MGKRNTQWKREIQNGKEKYKMEKRNTQWEREIQNAKEKLPNFKKSYFNNHHMHSSYIFLWENFETFSLRFLEHS